MHIAIIGGGISGLSLAYRLSQSRLGREGKITISLYDEAKQLGGVIQTETNNHFLMEKGPDSFITAKIGALELCKELGLENDLIETNPQYRQSYILQSDQLIPVPRGFYLMAPTNLLEGMKTPLLSLRGKIRMASEWFIPPKKEAGDESLASFVRRRFGQEMLERIAQPMIAGIYTADPEELSLEATFPHFLRMEQKYGSVMRGLIKSKDPNTQKASGPRYSLFLSLRHGMHSLVQALISRMPDVSFHAGQKVIRLEEGWKVFLENGKKEEADIVCLALPAPSAARLLQEFSEEISGNLKKISYGNVATINMAFSKKSITRPLNGLGFVVPSIENKAIVGCTFSSIKFSDRAKDDNTLLMRAFVGGRAAQEILGLPDDKLIKKVREEICSVLKINHEPTDIRVSRWQEAMPQYQVGHCQTIEKLFAAVKKIKGLYLAGNGYQGMGIPDCINRSSLVAKEIESHLENTSKSAQASASFLP